MKSLLPYLVRLSGWREERRLLRGCRDPETIQSRLLANLLDQNRATQFGREHGFAKLRGTNEYRRKIPIRDYTGHRPYIERIMSGERRVLTRDPPFMFNTTSGTTDVPKYIPWNSSVDKASRALTRLWVHRVLRDHPTALNHHVLCMVSPAVEGHIGGTPFGSASGHIYRTAPAAVRQHYVLPYEIAEINDYDARYFVALRFAMEHRISVVSTANPGTLVRLAETGARWSEQLIRSIRNGTLGIELPRQPELGRSLAETLAPNPARAARLEKAAQGNGTLRPKDYWPELALIGCWTGSSIGARTHELALHYGDVPIRDLGFLASEARMTLPIADRTPAGILAINTNFYEFVPEDETPGEHTRTLLCHELELGKRYYIILTTPGGLYRYDINDIVEVVDFHARCPIISFMRKGRDVTSITGEKLHVNHCLAAMRRVGNRIRGGIRQFRFVADNSENRYRVLLEPYDQQQTIGPELISCLDAALADVNMEYAQKRRSHRLRLPALQIMRCGWSESEIRAAATAGRRHAEYKWRHLAPEPAPLDLEWIEATLNAAYEMDTAPAMLKAASA